MPTTTASRSPHLDGLRGIASVMVFFNHLALSVLPSISMLQPDASGIAALVTVGRTPVSVIWGGDFGVCIFFVLSGYVLSQFYTTTDLGFPAMLARRYARLAIPMVFSTLLAFLLLKAGLYFNKQAADTVSHSGWFALWYQMPASSQAALNEGLWSSFISGKSAYNSNLWTMRIELIGSIAIFMLYSIISRSLYRVPVLVIAMVASPGYYPLFAIGALLFELFRLEQVAAMRPSRLIGALALAIFAAGILAGGFPASGTHTGISSPWHRWFIDSDNAQAWHIAGATLVMIAVLQSRPLARVLSSRFFQFFGRLSFPIYLIQIPLLCSFTALLLISFPIHHYWLSASMVMVATVLVMVPLAWLTLKFVEVPALKLSKRVGQLSESGWWFIRNRLPDRLQHEGDNYFRDEAFLKSKLCYQSAKLLRPLRASSYCTLALIYLIRGREKPALRWLRAAAAADSFYWTGDYDVPRKTDPGVPARKEDTCFGGQGLLYSGYNFAAMRAFQVGFGKASTDLAKNAVLKQSVLKPLARAGSKVLDFLSRHELHLDDVHIFPETWIIQIGHIGMLDLMLRMRRLGWWSGTAVLLAPQGLVANNSFLSLVGSQPGVVTVCETRDSAVVQDFNSLLRSHGLPYHVFQPPEMPFVRWHEAAALAMYKHSEFESCSLTPSFDSSFARDLDLKVQFRLAMEEWNIAPDDWYVCLHVRELGYHSAAVDAGHRNRNADLANYKDAIDFIVSLGGRVIKMGSPNSPKSDLPGLIDYAHSEFKSEPMDIALIRHAKFFIGTTSGLVNVAIGLGLPVAQVNCLTTEYQPWSSTVRFCLKPILRADGTMLSQRDMTSDARWALSTIQSMVKHGLTSIENSPDEILETVREVYALATGVSAEPDPIIGVWRASLAVPHAYGAAQPSVHFLRKYADRFLVAVE
jgi:putative glycosyltransferase (TIGR04372 family)